MDTSPKELYNQCLYFLFLILINNINNLHRNCYTKNIPPRIVFIILIQNGSCTKVDTEWFIYTYSFGHWTLAIVVRVVSLFHDCMIHSLSSAFVSQLPKEAKAIALLYFRICLRKSLA